MVDPKANARLNAEALDLWLAADDEPAAEVALDTFIDAASLLSGFDPEKLQSTDGRSPDTREAIALVDHSVRLAGTNLRQLRDAVSRSAIIRLGNREALRQARAANPGTTDPLQRGIDLLLAAEAPPDLSDRPLSDLLGLQQAIGWLAGVSNLTPPDPQLLDQRIERERVLQPMRRLLANGFVGRDAELSQLRSYIGVLSPQHALELLDRVVRHVRYRMEERPPLFLFGPGGIGKSTLLAKFILDHANPSDRHPMPFIYLDFDRASLDPGQMHTLMTEALRQIGAQFPDLIDREHIDEGLEAASSFESVQVSKGAQYGRKAGLFERLAKMLDQLATRNGQPVLFVLDTFEEAQTQGESAVRDVWSFLSQLMRQVDGIRIVVAGRRALAPDYPHEAVEITSFDEATAVQFLEIKTKDVEGGPISHQDARAIFNLIKIQGERGQRGAVPLSLALAARIVLGEGLGALKSTVQRRRLFASITAEQQQGMLNTRVLQHLHGKDPDLRKLVDSGLIVRRINPTVIRKVLADLCDIEVADDNRALELFNALSKEIALVDADRESGAVWHLPTVRRAMLPLLKKTLGDTKLRAIHDAAVKYYDAEGGALAKAEALFHRLSRGDPAFLLDPEWDPDLAPQLRSAYDELEGQAKLWLAGKLGLEVDEALRGRADLGDWELQAEIRARSLLSSGLAGDALAALRERLERTEASPLPALEADALLLLGQPTEARDVVLTALLNGESAANAGVAATLLMRLSTIDERDLRFQDALQAAEDAMASYRLVNDTLLEIGASAAVFRLRSRLGLTIAESERRELIDLASRPEIQAALRGSPAILRELAAVLGSTAVGVVADALEVLGIERETLVPLAARLHDILAASLKGGRLGDALSRLADGRTGVSTAGLGREFAHLLRGNTVSSEVTDILVDAIAATVQTSVDQVVRSQPEGVELGRRQQSELCAAISANLRPYEFQQLVYTALDVDPRTLSSGGDSYEHHVEQVVQSLVQTHRLTKLLESMLRSPVVGPALNSVVVRLLAQRGTVAKSDLAIDLNDLNGLQRRELSDVITALFSPGEFEMLLAERMKLRLADLVNVNAPFRQVALDVIAVSQRQGWTDQLLAFLQAERPHLQILPDLMNRLTLLSIDGDRNLSGRSLARTIEQGGFIDPAAWTSGLMRLSGQVCRIESSTGPVGTGFLVGPDLVLTAFHVVEREIANGDGRKRPALACRFDYAGESEIGHRGVVGELADDWLVSRAANVKQGSTLPTRNELDYALIRLSSEVGLQPGRSSTEPRGWIDLGRQTRQVQQESSIFILQHAEGGPLRISAGKVLGTNGNGTRLRYDADTRAVSSGGPCVDAAFNVVALHHAGYKAGLEIYNEGIPVGLIVAHLGAAGIELPEPEADIGGGTA